MASFLAGALIGSVGDATALAQEEVPRATTERAGPREAPAFVVFVESDAPEIVSYDGLAPALGAELGEPVLRGPTVRLATRCTLYVAYAREQRRLTVRAVRPDGTSIERTVGVTDAPDAVRREVVLLAGNLARDEAKELLDALAARPAKPAPVAIPSAAPDPPPKAPVRTRPPEGEGDGEAFATASVLYPLASNAGRPRIATSLDVSMLYGRVGAVRGAQVGFGLSIATRHLEGSQLASGVVVLGDATGAQVGGLVSVATGRVVGSTLGGAVAYAGDLDGVQTAGLLGVTRRRMAGLQLAGAGNVVGEQVRGVQIAGVANVTLGPARGLQLAGAVNVAGDVAGTQLAGVNVAGDVHGAQLGLVNVAGDVHGVQIGLVNVADDADAAIGLVNVTRKGVHAMVWGSTSSFANVGLKFASRYMYTLLSLGFGTPEVSLAQGLGAVGAGVGTNVVLWGPLDLDLDTLVAQTSTEDSASSDTNLVLHARALPGYRFASHLRVFAGGGARFPLRMATGSLAVTPEATIGAQF